MFRTVLYWEGNSYFRQTSMWMLLKLSSLESGNENLCHLEILETSFINWLTEKWKKFWYFKAIIGNSADNMITLVQTVLYASQWLEGKLWAFFRWSLKAAYETGRLRLHQPFTGGKYEIHNFETPFCRPLPSVLRLYVHPATIASLPFLLSFLLPFLPPLPLINNNSRFSFYNLTHGLPGLSSQEDI